MGIAEWAGVPGWQQLPTWLTLAAVVAAGIFAQRAAHWTKNQALTATAALTQAKDEARDARAAADRVNSRIEESRLDALAPVIYARATPGAAGAPGFPPIEYREVTAGIAQEQYTIPEGPNGVRLDQSDSRRTWQFRITKVVVFENVSDRVARVEINGIDDLLRFDAPRDFEFTVAPGRQHELLWQRELNSGDLASSALDTPDNTTFDVHFLVSDLASNVRDLYAFNGNLRHFSRPSGSEDSLFVHAEPYTPPWTETVAVPKGRRSYPRLDVPPEAAGMSAPA